MDYLIDSLFFFFYFLQYTNMRNLAYFLEKTLTHAKIGAGHLNLSCVFIFLFWTTITRMGWAGYERCFCRFSLQFPFPVKFCFHFVRSRIATVNVAVSILLLLRKRLAGDWIGGGFSCIARGIRTECSCFSNHACLLVSLSASHGRSGSVG
jgi:hypothetical protein